MDVSAAPGGGWPLVTMIGLAATAAGLWVLR
jgi:hypothetical protein